MYIMLAINLGLRTGVELCQVERSQVVTFKFLVFVHRAEFKRERGGSLLPSSARASIPDSSSHTIPDSLPGPSGLSKVGLGNLPSIAPPTPTSSPPLALEQVELRPYVSKRKRNRGKGKN